MSPLNCWAFTQPSRGRRQRRSLSSVSSSPHGALHPLKHPTPRFLDDDARCISCPYDRSDGLRRERRCMSQTGPSAELRPLSADSLFSLIVSMGTLMMLECMPVWVQWQRKGVRLL